MATGNELRQMTGEELVRMSGELRSTLVNLRLKHRTGHLENSAEIAKSRRELARVLTLIREGALGIQRQVKAVQAPSAAGAEEKTAKKAAKKAKAGAPAAARKSKSKSTAEK